MKHKHIFGILLLTTIALVGFKKKDSGLMVAKEISTN